MNRILNWLDDLDSMRLRPTLEELDKMISYEIQRANEEVLASVMVSIQDLYRRIDSVASTKSKNVQVSVAFCKKKTFDTLKSTRLAYRKEIYGTHSLQGDKWDAGR